MNVLEAKDLSFAYGNTPVLDAASFTMCEGGFAALVMRSTAITPPGGGVFLL